MGSIFETEQQFEDEVRRIARLLWPVSEFAGAAMIDGRERDAVFATEDVIHIIECTVSRKKDKATSDGSKLVELIEKKSKKYPSKVIKGWFITLAEPTADQRTAIARFNNTRIVALSFDQFRSRLVDARTYLERREDYPFGSVRNPDDGKPSNTIEYVPLDLVDQAGAIHRAKQIALGLRRGDAFVLLGDYGAGKSSTIRDLHAKLATAFWKDEIVKFPITLNLRDHHGQEDPTEALERHARKIGFGQPSHLVRAWRAGYVILLLDGFDEIASAGWSGKVSKLKDMRYRAMTLVRNFVRETPLETGIVLAGRAHFFDSHAEMTQSLGIDQRYQKLNLSEFSSEQIAAYLRKQGWNDAVPDWLPSRPLLLGYLASRGLLKETLELDAGSAPAMGWDKLIERIAQREAEIEAGIDPATVRKLLERLATIARASVDGLGPLSPNQIVDTFTEICGYPPDDRGHVLLMRLPGLGASNSDDSSRKFIDQDFVETARAGDVFAFIQDPYSNSFDSSFWQSGLEPLGIDVIALKCHKAGHTGHKLSVAAKIASSHIPGTLCSDVVRAIQQLGLSYEGSLLYVRDVLLPELDFDSFSGNLNLIEFHNALIRTLDLPSEADPGRLPRFVQCYILNLEGRTGAADLPANIFIEPIVENYSLYFPAGCLCHAARLSSLSATA